MNFHKLMENANQTNKIESFPGESIIKGMPQIAYIFTRDGRLRVWNKNAEDIIGYTPEEMYNRLLTDFVDESDREKLTDVLSAVFLENKEQTVAYNLITKSGKRLPHWLWQSVNHKWNLLFCGNGH